MPLMNPEELRAFARALPHPDFSNVNGALPTRMTGEMPEELFSVNEFIDAWAPLMVRFGDDFRRGIEVFRTVAEEAADRYEAVDANHGAIMTELVDGARTDQQSTDLSGLPQPRPDTGPLTPPKDLALLLVERPGHHSYGGYNSGFDFDN